MNFSDIAMAVSPFLAVILAYIKLTPSGMKEVDVFRQTMDRAFKAISTALDMDQNNEQFTKIVVLYDEGIRDLKSCLEMKFTTKEAHLAASTQREQMITSLQFAERRIAEIKNMHRNVSPPQIPVSALKSISDISSIPSKAVNSKVQQPRSKEADILAHQILDEILLDKPNVPWDSIVGLQVAKKALHEIVVLPYIRPELFTGLRSPARGVLLFGPPGTGKTMLAKAVATESKARFFAISASTLTSKNYGDGEKLVKALFSMARELQPSIIFIDEIDSILTARSDSEHEASRRLKTEFLLQFDGIGSTADDRILLLAATNRPQELDQAALRRLVKRIYIPLPELDSRMALLQHLLLNNDDNLSKKDLYQISTLTDGYSSSDITALAREASMGPIRDLGSKLLTTSTDKIRPIALRDFHEALKMIRPSVSSSYVDEMKKWNREKGAVDL